MLTLKPVASELKPESRHKKFRWDLFFSELSLFVSACLARLIVSGELRRRNKERGARRKRITLAPTAEPLKVELPLEILGDPQCKI
jgi:hypothetical protein